ncbi:ribosome hibernation-promoting factor, HPF/YfiA family [Echinimonas agarilytica]|uniref:Ribosome-associated translation inhibitor RaiA n=1 Tax=Echinimonas agarilytica TaxID=1215918 RepID=A0AA41W581_9GAMM|nr:ribosome-associated translation inhibitor RaiA [Echinimonas agarilytica]MCM2678929.1 ribosome-associated translation inhibitor RaiA [Echinimonas agarilytica]
MIEITCKTMSVTPSMKEHVLQAFEKLNRFDTDLFNPHVIVDKDGLDIVVEARIGIPGSELFAKAQHEEFNTATNRLVDKLKQQLIRYRGKQTASRTQAA